MPSNVGDSEATPSSFITTANVSVYVISGCTQPLLMTLLKNAGVANSSCQLYMLFYYLGPASIIFSLHKKGEEWPAKEALLKATGIALFDIVAASMNYTGAALAGPTIFAIVYSSVTIWAAIFSQFFLARSMNFYQWLCVFVVFLGLTLTTTHSRHLGHDVVNGLILIILGSMMHALTYVMCEGIVSRIQSKILYLCFQEILTNLVFLDDSRRAQTLSETKLCCTRNGCYAGFSFMAICLHTSKMG